MRTLQIDFSDTIKDVCEENGKHLNNRRILEKVKERLIEDIDDIILEQIEDYKLEEFENDR